MNSPLFPGEDGIEIIRIVSDSPSEGILKQGMIIESIKVIKLMIHSLILNVVVHLNLGDNVTVQTNQGTYTIELGKNPNNESIGFFGIQAANISI